MIDFTLLRIAGYYLIAIVFWCLWCLPPLIRHDHLAFQSAGTIIIAAAIIRIGLDRAKFERYLNNYDRNSLVSAIERLEAHRTLNEKRLDFTFDLHLSQISRLCQAVRVPNHYGPQSPQDVADLERSISERHSAYGDTFTIKEDAQLAEDLKRIKENAPMFRRWRTHAFRLEVFFLVIGTLQTGYGAVWSALVEEYQIVENLRLVLLN